MRMTSLTPPALLSCAAALRLQADKYLQQMARALLVLLSFFAIATPGQAEVSMTLDGYDLRYSSGSFKMSETYGQQLIDIEDVVISSQQGERFTADHLMLKATGTMGSLDWVESAEVINASLISTTPSGYDYELRSELIQAENIHLDQTASLEELADRLHQDRARPTYLKLVQFFLAIPDEGFLFEIEEFIADGNPDLMNNQLPPGQHISEVTLKTARLSPSGSGEASLMFRFMLSGLGLEALQLDARASALSRFNSGQINGEFRLELDADKLLGANLDIDTVIDEERYQTLLKADDGNRTITPEQQAALAASLFKGLNLSIRDAGALRIYDSLSSSFGLPDRRQLALLTEYQIQDRLNRAAGFLAVPVADFIRAGGRLSLSAQPDALTTEDFSGDEDTLLQSLVDKAELSLTHTP